VFKAKSKAPAYHYKLYMWKMVTVKVT